MIGAKHFYAIEVDKLNGGIDIHAFNHKSVRDYWVKAEDFDERKFSREAISAKECDDLFRRNRESDFIRHNQEPNKKGNRECSRS